MAHAFHAPPHPRGQVLAIVEPHLDTLAKAIEDAWSCFAQVHEHSVSQMKRAGASARGMLVAGFLRGPVHRRFQGVRGVSVDDRYGRPWVNLDGDLVQVRFKKLTPQLAVCLSDTERRTRRAFRLGDLCFPSTQAATQLPLAPLSTPIIRLARAASHNRLEREHGS